MRCYPFDMRWIPLTVILFACGGRIEAEASHDAGPETPSAPAPLGSVSHDGDAIAPPSSTPKCDPAGLRAGSSGSACLDAAHWREIAADACELKGGVASLQMESACGFFSYRVFRCCGADGVCSDHRDGSPSSCKDIATWKSYSEGDCAREGRALKSLTFDTPCSPTSGYLGASYQCCRS